MIKKFAFYFSIFTSISLLLNLIFENFIEKAIIISLVGGIVFAGLMVLIQRKNILS